MSIALTEQCKGYKSPHTHTHTHVHEYLYATVLINTNVFFFFLSFFLHLFLPLFIIYFLPVIRRFLCGLVVRVSGYRHRGPGFDPRRYQIF